MLIKECFAILELPPESSLTEVKAAYRDLAQVWHPDRFQNSPRLRDKAQEKMKTINEAYSCLQQYLTADVHAEAKRKAKEAAQVKVRKEAEAKRKAEEAAQAKLRAEAEAKRKAEEHERWVADAPKRDAEEAKRKVEEEARKEAQRREQEKKADEERIVIQEARYAAGCCMLCGRALGLFQNIIGHKQHAGCSIFFAKQSYENYKMECCRRCDRATGKERIQKNGASIDVCAKCKEPH